MTVLNPVSYLHNRTDHTAQTDRLATSSLLVPTAAGLTYKGGVRGRDDLAVTQRGAGANMSVDVAAGTAHVPQTNASQGAYVLCNDGTINLAIAVADPSFARNDLIVAKVEDSFFSGVANIGSIVVVQGVASSSPVDPVVPNNAHVLARVVVPSAAASIVNANITSLRRYSTALGGIQFIANSTERTALLPYTGQAIYYDTDKQLQIWNGTSWVPYGTTAAVAVTFMNSWSNFGGTDATCTYRKVGDETVIEGVVKHGTAGATSAIFTLPVGFRPLADHRFGGTIGAGGAACTVEVAAATGLVTVIGGYGSSNSRLGLTGMRFRNV